MKYLFENENLKAKVLYDFKDFVLEILDDPRATTDKYYSSYREFCRKIEKLADSLGELGVWGLDYRQDELEASKDFAKQNLEYNIEGMLDIDVADISVNKNEILAYTMVWMLRKQLHNTRTDLDHVLYKFMETLEDEMVDEVALRLRNELKDEKENRITESSDSYFGDSELDNADYPNGILHQRFDRHGKWQKRSIDDWSGRVGWAKKKDFYLNANAAFKEFLDLAIDIPSLLGSLDKTVEMENGNSASRTKLSELLTVGLNSSDSPFWYFTPQVEMKTEAINQCPKNIRTRIFAAISRNYKPVLGEVKEFIRNADSAEDVYVLDDNGIPVRVTQKFFKLLRQCIVTSARGLAKDLTEILKDEE